MTTVTVAALMMLQLVLFALALGLTLLSFQAYRQNQSQRLEYAFIGFAFLSMGVAMTNIGTQLQSYQTSFQIAETLPFIIGFGMLYASLYR